SDDINKVENFLDSFTVSQGYTIDNSKGTNDAAASDDWGDNELPTENNSVFINAPVSYDNNKKEIFNDRLMLINRKDFEAIYERMDFWVTKKVSKCLENVTGSDYRKHFFRDARADGGFLEAIGDWDNPEDGTYRAEDTPSHDVESHINNYVNDKILQCKAKCDDKLDSCNDKCSNIATCKLNCEGDTDCEKDCGVECDRCIQINTDCKSADKGCDRDKQKYAHRKDAIEIEQSFPWVANVNDPSCFNVKQDDVLYDNSCQPVDGNRFGRIPNIPNNVDNGMLTKWTDDCFNNFWWDGWKDKVFYAIDSNHIASDVPHFWIKTVRKTWINEAWNIYNTRKTNIKIATFARIKADDKNDWEFVSIPTLTATDTLKLNDDKAKNFVILVAGRRLDNQTRSDDTDKVKIVNYLEGQNIVDFQEYLDTGTCPMDISSSSKICRFEKKKTGKNFNDIVCKDRKYSCTIPQ
ncbi:hypothetical protein QUF50_08635, partial [Thiotrichales bacterium HSG1]|nr:hypothetical protein [Thiotrichales bacterium HSG1]